MSAGSRRRGSRRRRLGTLTSRGRSRLALVGVLIAFTVSLVLWAGHSPARPVSIRALPAPLAAVPTAPVLPDGGIATATTQAPVQTRAPAATGSGQPAGQAHTIVFRASSDRSILALSYLVTGGHPAKVYRIRVASPVLIRTSSTASGTLGRIGVQASPGARTISCSMTVDGAVVSTYTAHGGFSVAVCQG